jgi:cardiolipin synthase
MPFLQSNSLFDDPLSLFSAMLEDIRNAKRSILLQTYKFGNDSIGQKFRDELTKAAKRGVKVRLLIDSWGAGVAESYFEDLINLGGEVKFFEKIKFSLDVFSRNHRRNHRKILIIDQNLSYIGSANITAYCLSWRECVIRMTSDISHKFERIFNTDWLVSSKLYHNKRLSTRILRHGDIEIIRDVPGNIRQPVRKKYQKMIREAKDKIIIETPYFLPGLGLRRGLAKAAHRGVKIIVLTPENSDVMLFDILRNKYFGFFYKNGIQFLLYTPSNLHAKVILADDTSFITGSSNFDYRSFMFMHEINIAGKNPEIASLLKIHLDETIRDCRSFDYEKWKNRHFFQKIIEWLLVPVRHLF